MLRWVGVSPDGKRVAYTALGYVYVKDLPNGTPHRLTKQTDHWEFFPSWSRDSQSIVYATWNDESLGSIRVASVAVRRFARRDGQARPLRGPRLLARRLEDRLSKGHRRLPALARVVVRARPLLGLRGGIRQQVHSHHADRRLPAFGKDSDRVFFVKTEGGGDQIAPAKRVLASIKLDGSDEHEHYLSELAQEFAVSPDGRWLAFRERFNAYVTPFVETGRRVDIGPKSKAVPVTRVSKDAGENLALLRRLLPALLVVRAGALPARPEGSVRVPAGRAREAAGAAGAAASTSPSRRRSTRRRRPTSSPSRAAASSR